VHELINGYYHRNDHDELKLRFGAFPGGSANSASWMGQWSYELGEIDVTNVLWAVTRMHFEPLDICKYETNGSERQLLYGFHNCSMGFISDIHSEKKKNNVAGQSAFAEQAKKTLAKVEARKYNLSYLPKSDGNEFPAMPGLNDEVGPDWKTYECHAFSVMFCHYPIYHPTFDMTKRVN